MDPEEIISRASVNSGEELYSTLNRVPGIDAGVIETNLPGNLKANSEGLMYYQGEVEISAVAGEVTAARNEASEIYWCTDGENTYWMEDGELREAGNHRVEELHRVGQQILEPETDEQEFFIEGQQPGLFTSGPLQIIPEGRRGKLRQQIEDQEEIDMMQYSGNLGEDPRETAESMARELNKKLRRKPGYQQRRRNGTVLR